MRLTTRVICSEDASFIDLPAALRASPRAPARVPSCAHSQVEESSKPDVSTEQHKETQLKQMLADAAEKQQAALVEGHTQLREFAQSLQTQQEQQAARQAKEWKALLAEAVRAAHMLEMRG